MLQYLEKENSRRLIVMLYELLKSRRSVRKFEDREIEKEKVDLIIKSALLSPSSRGIRPWEFIVVNDKETIKKLSQCKEYDSAFLSGAPLAIVVVADHASSDVWVEDASIASAIIHLAAHSTGLGSCWIQVRERFHAKDIKSEDYVSEVLGIPEKSSVLSIVAIGYPDENKKAYNDDGLLYGKVHYNKFNI